MKQSISIKIQDYKQDKSNALNDIILQMEPLVIKYAKKTFFLEFDDAKQEYYLCIIYACKKIRVWNNDEQCLKYLKLSIKNKYLTFCKEYYSSPVLLPINEDMLYLNSSYDIVIMMIVIKKYFDNLYDKHGYIKSIFYYSTYIGLNDVDIGSILGLSRQYVHLLKIRLERDLKAELELTSRDLNK